MIVGVDINSSNAVVVLVDDNGGLCDGLPDRFEPSPETDEGARLHELVERVAQRLRSAGATQLAMTQVSQQNAKPSAVRETAYLEAAVMLAAHRASVSTAKVHQKSIGTHIGLSSTAKRADIREAVSARVGSAALSPDPDRRARAVAAAWWAAGILPEEV